MPLIWTLKIIKMAYFMLYVHILLQYKIDKHKKIIILYVFHNQK